MGMKLSHELLDLGFFSALGTLEYCDGKVSDEHVKRGKPNTIDSNNGVLVIYDEEGRPWIIRNGPSRAVGDLTTTYNLRWGAYVPHSNDGGRFICEVLPELMRTKGSLECVYDQGCLHTIVRIESGYAVASCGRTFPLSKVEEVDKGHARPWCGRCAQRSERFAKSS